MTIWVWVVYGKNNLSNAIGAQVYETEEEAHYHASKYLADFK